MRTARYFRIYLVGLFMAIVQPILAGIAPGLSNPYVVDEWDTDRGLPQNTVTSIIQTKDGYLWFGTLNGLVRFDGLRFKVFDEINTPGLLSSRIHKLFEDSRGGLWLGTETAGFLRIQNGHVSKLGVGQSGFERRLTSVCESTNGLIWLYTADGQVWSYSSNHFTPYVFGLNSASRCRVIITEPEGPVWIGSDWRLGAIAAQPRPGLLEVPLDRELVVTNRLDFLLASKQGGYWRLSGRRIYKYRHDQMERDLGDYPWGATQVTSAVEDSDGNLVVGTLGEGIYLIRQDGAKTQLWSGQGRSDRVVLSLCVDREGSLWIGTDGGGLKRVKKRAFQIINPSGGPETSAQSVCADAEGGLWIGLNGGFASYLKNGVVQFYGPAQGLVNPNVWSVYADRQGRVWVGTYGGGLFFKQEERFEPAPGAAELPRVITAIYQDRKGLIWVGTPNGLACWDEKSWKLYTTRDGLSSDEVRALVGDGEDNLWIGTIGGGLNYLQNGRFLSFHTKDGLPSEDISALHLDEEGVLWIATPGKGLGRWQQGKSKSFTTADGLTSNSIGYLIEDRRGYFWMGSYAGILRVARRELNEYAQGHSRFILCRAYGRQDGLPTLECTQGSQPGGGMSADGTIWLPTVKGVVSVDPATLNPNPHPPPAIIENVGIDGQLQNTNLFRPEIKGEVMVPVGKESIDIYYTSLNLTGADRSRFRYRLEGHETVWIEAGTTRVAHYSKLPPGHYEFQVKACNEDGIWNEQATLLAIWVQTPLWRTWWFLSLLGLVSIGAIAGAVHFISTQKLKRQVERLRQQEALERERSRIAQDIHDQLGANLTQVTLLGEMLEGDKEDPTEVENHARQIIKTARETVRSLDEIVWAVNPTNDTLDGLMTYLFKQAQDYLTVAGLRYRLDVPDQLPVKPIPPDVRHNIYMAFKEAITNVVRHARASFVSLRLKLEPTRFLLEIEDDGKGLSDFDENAARLRNGLSGMRKRMEAIGGRFSIGPAPHRGAQVLLEAPLDYGDNPPRARSKN